MTIRVDLDVGGTLYNDFKFLRVEKSLGEYIASSNFRAVLDNPFGRHKDDFTVGNEVTIRADKDTNPTTVIFVGILEDIRFQGMGTKQEIILTGRDFSARLQDSTIEPAVYTNSEVSTIVTDIINNNVEDITTTNVDTTEITIPRISFNQQSVFNALNKLSELSNFIFFIDTNKDLHFKKRAETSSGVTLNNTNTIEVRFDTTREKMVNKVWVYGDRQLSGAREVLDVGSPFAGGQSGSVFTLLSRPHHAEIESSDFPGSVLKGGIFEFVPFVTSGPDYLVNFEDKQIIFVSGTDIGYNTIPTSGGSIIAIYDKEIPIAKFGEDAISIQQFGPKTKVIQDTSIKDSQTATELVKNELKNSQPLKKIEFFLKGWFTFSVGETLNVILDDFNLDEQNFPIINITYNFDSFSVEEESVIKVRINKKIIDITDTISDINERLKSLAALTALTPDVLTRLEIGIGSMLVVGSYWEARTIWNGSGFIIGGSGVSRGSGQTTGPWLGRLGSFTAGSASHLGTAGQTSPETQASGGYSY